MYMLDKTLDRKSITSLYRHVHINRNIYDGNNHVHIRKLKADELITKLNHKIINYSEITNQKVMYCCIAIVGFGNITFCPFCK
jgi:hypothetical protein